jgi:hypothetical protein
MTTFTALKTGILKHLLGYLMICIIFLNNAQAQKIPTIGAKKLRQAAANFQRAMPQEKVFLHTDKDLYFAGDTLWFKAYVLDATYLSASEKSKLLFIELQDDSTDIISRVSVVIKDGIGNAQIPLPRNAFHEGGYTIKAYTNWMQNFGSSAAFSKRIYIGKIAKDSWLASSTIKVNTAEGKDQLVGEIYLKDLDRMPVGLRNLNVMVIDSNRVLLDKNLQTSLDGKFKLEMPFSQTKLIRSLRIEILDLRKDGIRQRLQIPLFINRAPRIDLQFLPEGGQLVAGVPGVVAFKAISESGAGVNVSGVILDSKGKQVAVFESLHRGMGNVKLKPVSGEKYIAKITHPAGSETVYKLPLIKTSGTNISVENEELSDSIKVLINASADLIAKKQLFYLVGSARGLVSYVKPVILNGAKVVKIPKTLFPEGIARILLLKEKVVINERSVFIDHRDRLSMVFSAGKPTYKTRDNVSIELEVKDKSGKPVVGSFSLSVTDDGQVLSDQNGNQGIDVSLLLNSNLKGLIEEPGFYLNRTSPLAWQALDNLLLTQGWVGYDWKAAFQPFEIPKFDKTTLSKTKWFGLKHMEFPVVKNYQLEPWFLEGLHKKILYPKDAVIASRKEITSTENLLDEVTITGKRQWKGVGFADIVLDSNDIKNTGAQNVYQILRQKLPGSTIEPYYSWDRPDKHYKLMWQGRQILRMTELDGKSDHLTLISYKEKEDVRESWMNESVNAYRMIEIMYSEQYTDKFFPHKPARSFKPGERALLLKAYAEAGIPMPNENEPKAVVVRLTFERSSSSDFYNSLSMIPSQKYYQPKYLPEFAEVKNQRATVHWEPNIITNKDGKAIISFHTTDEAGSYSLNIQGADLMGRFGSKRLSIKVE